LIFFTSSYANEKITCNQPFSWLSRRLQIDRTTTFTASTIWSDSGFVPGADFYPADGLCPAGGFIACIIFASAVAALSKDFAFGEILSFVLPKESIQRKRNPTPLDSACAEQL